MMREERLLERIAKVGGEDRKGTVRDEELLAASVIAYLNKILNTRKGSVLMDPEFGVPDYSGMASRFSTADNETLQDIEAAVRSAVLRGEPRFQHPRVRLLDKDEFELSLLLDLEGKLQTAQGMVTLNLKVRMHPDGRIQVYH